MNGINGVHAYTNGVKESPRLYRPPTVDEALQYSPLSSIVPFEPGIIPVPSTSTVSSGSLLSSQAERLASRRDYEALNVEASKHHDTSSRLQKTLEDLQQLLYADDLTQFKFKRDGNRQTNPQAQNQGSWLGGSNGADKRDALLTPFADMVLKSTQVAYCYPSTASLVSHRSRNKPYLNGISSPRTPQAAISSPSSISKSNQNSFAANAKSLYEFQGHGLLTPGRTPPVPAVIVPPLPPSSNEADYKIFPHIDAQVHLQKHEESKKRKREEADASDEVIAVSIDKRQKAHAALEAFQELLGDLFEAEDRLEADSSGSKSADVSKYFVWIDDGDSRKRCLASTVCHRLDSTLQTVISLDRFRSIRIDDLGRLQKLCEGVLDCTQALDLTVGTGWSDADIEEWLGKMGSAANGLSASKLILKIMTAGWNENQLHPEELLHTVVNTLKHVLDCCLIPAVECRDTQTQAEQFSVYSAQQKSLAASLQQCGKVLKLLGGVLSKTEVSESIIAAIVFLAMRLIFVENASTDKDSTLGVQRFENTRRSAMDVVAKAFLRYPDQRTYIFDEILTSLEKLPVARQSARQYKLIDGKPIQLVSALLMRLIQTSAMQLSQAGGSRGVAALTERFTEDRDLKLQEQDAGQVRSQTAVTPHIPVDEPQDALQGLTSVARPLLEAAQSNAHYVAKFMVQRALSATKRGDQPYRNLLDIFTEDFLAVLGSTDWPAAEVLLRSLLSNLIGLIESDKSTVPAKNMALDLMGLMGSGIVDLQIYVRNAARTMQTGDSEVDSHLRQISEEMLAENDVEQDLIAEHGPYRIAVEYLHRRDLDDAQLQSARGYYIVQWAKHVLSAYGEELRDGTEGKPIAESASLSSWIKEIILDPARLENESHFSSVSTAEARLSYALTVLAMPFCRAQKRLFGILLNSMSSEHASVKSKSLKSVVQLLEKDPSILDRGSYVISHILRCSSDSSSLVRDSALSLLGKCISLRPTLEAEVFKAVIGRTADTAVGVRKRAMKLLKEIYLQNQAKQLRILIAEALLHRLQDAEESVSDLASQIFEDIWMSPSYTSPAVDAKEEIMQTKLALRERVSLVIDIVHRGENVGHALELLWRNALSAASKNAEANFQVCRHMVATMFDGVIDDTGLPGKPSQPHILESLTVFAKANPKLFTAEQLEILQPYVENLATSDDLYVYRSVLIIFRHVFPTLASLKEPFLKGVQDALLSSVPKLGKMELSEVSSCLWTINGMLKNTDRLTRLVISVLSGIHASKDVNLQDQAQQATASRVKRYIMIAGFFGRACNFDTSPAPFKDKFSWWTGDSVSGLMIDMLSPFANVPQPPHIREMALESIGMICQAWPKHFLKEQLNTMFDAVFQSANQRLEHVVLCSFKNLFVQEELQSAPSGEVSSTTIAKSGSEKLGKSFAPNENDGVSTSVAQRFLTQIQRISQATTDGYALTATELIASISRQGLVHPKEYAAVLVSLETSPNAAIATLAFKEHRALHHKHETMLEKEYLQAVHQAFIYQRDVVGDPLGVTFRPLNAKLRPLFEVLKLGNVKIRKKFLQSLCSKVDFEPEKLDSSGTVPPHLLYTRFLVENLALFDYSRVDELLYLVSSMEKIVAGTGTGIAHAIEAKLLSHLTAEELGRQENGLSNDETTDLHSGLTGTEELRHLAVSSAILSMLWETRTFLRRLWGFPKQRDAKVKATVKDLSKSPVKSPNISAEKYLQAISDIMASISSSEAMLRQCQTFVQLLSLDDEFKLVSDDEAADLVEGANGYETPSEERSSKAESVPPAGGGRGRKRKGSASAGATPKEARKTATPGKGRRRSKAGKEDDDMDWE